ncbi:hypothetical protein HK098_000739 [Nowakowskiella sp. JEL0407]|nr:hypothetical protein HK098_000739 [Nowakowskiella sp. JEL0407]
MSLKRILQVPGYIPKLPTTTLLRGFHSNYTLSAEEKPLEGTHCELTGKFLFPFEKPRTHKWSVLPRFRNPATNRLWTKRFINDLEPTPQSPTSKPIERVLVPKKMMDSYVEEFLPFKSFPAELENYVNFYGGVRIGKIFEDLDAMAGSAAYQHCDDGLTSTPPLTIVTASVDRIDLLSRIPANEDLRLSAYVTFVGKSSMEISLALDIIHDKIVEAEDGYIIENPTSVAANSPGAPDSEGRTPILVAKFTMVARDPVTGKAARVNPLVLETDEERELFRLGAEHKASKQFEADTSLEKAPPTVQEMFLVHKLHLESKQYALDVSKKPKDVIFMSETEKESVTLCMPQDRNIHNKIFGGYLMRLAYELAYCTAISFTNCRPFFLALDDILFKSPVNIGSMLHLKAKVVYSEKIELSTFATLQNVVQQPLEISQADLNKGDALESEDEGMVNTFQVTVDAFVEDPLTGEQNNTNTFHFTFGVPSTVKFLKVMPQSYDDSMQYIEGKRRKEKSIEMSRYNQLPLR